MVVAATSKEEAIVIANALPKQTFVVLYTEAVELDSIVPLDASPTIITRYETGE